MNPYVTVQPIYPGSPIRKVIARSADGMNAVEITLRFDTRPGPAKALALFARAAIEVCVEARKETHS